MKSTLKQLLRQDFTQYVRPHFEKSECEVCGSCTEHLHVHHVTHFQDLLDETLEQLHLEYHDDTDVYTEEELQLIRDVMLAKQMRIKYVTCCEPCHLELHEGNYFKTKKQGYGRYTTPRKHKSQIDEYTDEEIKTLINNLENLAEECRNDEYSFIGNEGRKYISSVLNLYMEYERNYDKTKRTGKTDRKRAKNVDAMNNVLMLYELPFHIEQCKERINRKWVTYYVVIDER
jgi:hypothetical protein